MAKKARQSRFEKQVRKDVRRWVESRRKQRINDQIARSLACHEVVFRDLDSRQRRQVLSRLKDMTRLSIGVLLAGFAYSFAELFASRDQVPNLVNDIPILRVDEFKRWARTLEKRLREMDSL